MKTRTLTVLVLALLFTLPALAQRKIIIPAGTPADQALTEISKEADAQKKTAALEDFVAKFADDKPAAAYGYWQLAQQYAAAGDQQKALAAGDKALAAMPDVLDIIVSQADLAQQLKLNEKVVDYAARGAAVYNGIPPNGDSPDNMATYKQQYDYLETIGYNAIASEQDAKKRLAEIDQYLAAFHNGRFAQNLATLAIVTFQEQKDTAGLDAFGDKVLAKSPNDMRLLTVLANAYISEPSGTHVEKAGTFARKAIELEAKSTDPEGKKFAGLAHSVLGQVLLRQNKFAPAATELKTASAMLTDSPQDQAGAYYYLGFAYAKLERGPDAIAALKLAANADTPYKKPAEEMLEKVQAARKRR